MLKDKKVIVVNESDVQNMVSNILTEAFYPSADKVLLIKEFLDKNFAKQELDTLDNNGYPAKEKTVVWMSNSKQPLKTLKMKELLLLLDDKFRKMISDKEDRRRFLKLVIKDWYYNNIAANGILSRNFI